MVEVLTIDACKKLLYNESASPTSEEYMKILDSMIVHIQSSDIELHSKEVAVIVDALKEPIRCLFNSIDTLKNELREIQKKYDKLNELECALFIGEIASHLEKKLVQIILNGTSVSFDYVTLFKLDEALTSSGRENRRTAIYISDKDKSIASKNWTRLDRDFGLNGEFYRAIDTLKRYRNSNAHPKFNCSDAYSCLTKLEGDHKNQEMAKKMLDLIQKLDCK